VAGFVGASFPTSPHRQARAHRRGPEDLGPLYALHADPAVWRHLPSGRHTSPEKTEAFIRQQEQAWEADGLGYWTARTARVGRDDGPGQLVGVGGCARRHDAVWNLYYRLTATAWGHGYAREIAEAGRAAATGLNPELPVVAYLLEHNTASRRTAESPRADARLARARRGQS
jgi:RimJ/RimL family protein N-acetyltransferase